MLAELGSNAVAQNADYKLQKVVIYCTEERLAEIEALEASGNIECAGDWQIITTNKGE
jgi:hypothetical protein